MQIYCEGPLSEQGLHNCRRFPSKLDHVGGGGGGELILVAYIII